MQQEVMFTACPRARESGALQISVVISPRLDPQTDPQVLATFPDFIDWPEKFTLRAGSISWSVEVNGGAPIAATLLSPLPNSDLWTGLFSPNTLVRGPVHPNYTAHLWHSYPVGHVVDFIHDLYQSIAVSDPDEHPHVDRLDASTLPLVSHLDERGRDRRPTLARLYMEKLRTLRAMQPAAADPENDFFQLWNFHQPGNLSATITPPTFDFHEVVALCSEHFGLMRRLGLVVDLLVPGVFADGAATLRVVPTWTSALGANSTDILPITHCTITPTRILATPKDPQEIIDGRLPLAGPRYRVVTVDPDGGAQNLMMLARNRIQAKLFPTTDTPQQEPLPALHSGGISIARTGHAAQLVDHVDSGYQLHTVRTAGNPLNVYAEDLWYGTRFDVWDAITGEWHSLLRRRGYYQFIDLSHTEEIHEEGAVIEAPTERSEDEPDPAFHMQESLMRWDGWSLAAPRPGRTLNEQDQVIPEPDDTSAGYPLRMRFQAEPGTLPRLRFGTRYQLRARTVDPAGNSVPFDNDGAHAATHLYLRYEPVSTPFVLLTAPRTEGESDAQPVLRSNYNSAPMPPTAQRVIAPPRTAQRTAEQHGMWDGAWNNPAQVYNEIVAREDKGFLDPGFGTPDPNNYDQPYFPQVPVPIPYLPDPMARGAALRFLPDSDDPPVEVKVSFNTAQPWPVSRPVRLIVEEGAGPPTVNETAGEIEVRYRLDKADTVRVRVSSYVEEADLAKSAIWSLMNATSPTAAQRATWVDLATRGRLWMLTPYRTLTLVHAVRQPLLPPGFQGMSQHRVAGETYTTINGLLNFSRKSTGRMDLHAHWQEPVDLGPGGGVAAQSPRIGENMREHEEWLEVEMERITGIGVENTMGFNRRHEFHDTKRRIVTYTAKATSKFTEFFQVRQTGVPVATNEVIDLGSAPLAEATELVRAPDDGPSYDRGTHYDINYLTGELTWKGAPATVDIVFLPEPTSRNSSEAETENAQERVLDIPSSARPLAPKVLYIVPTHRWLSMALGSKGEGGGLRVYLDRPFYDSGVGQLLGVVLDPSHNSPSAALAAYTTRWGFDPIQGPPAPPTRTPRPQDFPLAAPDNVGMNRVLVENGQNVNVAGHTVGYDTTRNLWYCDIEVESGAAHWPFIRLALASYQPHSVGNLHLSAVVTADIVQLTPDRTANLQLKTPSGSTPGGSIGITLIGAGPAQGGSSPAPGRTSIQMTAHLEQRHPGITDPNLGWQPIPGLAPITLSSAPGNDDMRVWSGDLPLPSPDSHAASQEHAGQNQPQQRVVVEEWQILPVSDEFRAYLPQIETRQTESGEGSGSAGEVPRVTRRLLYRDIIPLETPA